MSLSVGNDCVMDKKEEASIAEATNNSVSRVDLIKSSLGLPFLSPGWGDSHLEWKNLSISKHQITQRTYRWGPDKVINK